MSDTQTDNPEPSALPPAQQTLALLAERLGSRFLGTRQDRGEWTGWVELSAWVEAASFLKHESAFNVLSDLTAVDYLDRNPRFDLSIIVTSFADRASLRLKTMVSEDDCCAATLSQVWGGANWYEREVFDLFGIRFDQHPSLRRILLPADYQGHPLRKDYPVTGPATSAFR